mgnify:CR=1 FL=1
MTETRYTASDAEGVLDLLREIVSEIREVLDDSEWKAKDMQLREISRTVEKLDSVNVSVPDDLRRLKTGLAQELTHRDRAEEKRTELLSGLTAIVDELQAMGEPIRTTTKTTGSRRRRSRSSQTVYPELREALIEVLRDKGGSAPAGEILDEMAVRLDGKLGPEETKILNDGRPSWRYKTYTVRGQLIEEGILKDDSPMGRWELSLTGDSNAEEEDEA